PRASMASAVRAASMASAGGSGDRHASMASVDPAQLGKRHQARHTTFPGAPGFRSFARPSSARGARGSQLPEVLNRWGVGEGDECAISALMVAVLQTYENRTSNDIWMLLVEPLLTLVPCEDVKILVRSLDSLNEGRHQSIGAYDPTMRDQVKTVIYVERFHQKKIEAEAARTQRICRIPSPDASRKNWAQYEHYPHCGTIRCVAAVPLFDSAGNNLAVVKLMNRKHGSSPAPEFTRADLTALSAFSAIFACVLPHPFLGLPGTCLRRPPQAMIVVSDSSIDALVTWQLPKEAKGMPLQEVLYGEMLDESDGAVDVQGQGWIEVPCGQLQPCDVPGENCIGYEFLVRNLTADRYYGFCVRLSNMFSSLDWSLPSAPVSTFLAPPQPPFNAKVLLHPLSESVVRLEWPPFEACDTQLETIEYRVLAQPVLGTASGLSAKESAELAQVVAAFVSNGTREMESASVMNLQPIFTYSFAVEARYARVGTRDFSQGLVSSSFSFPSVDITLPGPQPYLADHIGSIGDVAWPQPLAAPCVAIHWPYPAELTSQLLVQSRHASKVLDPQGPRLNVSVWSVLKPSDYAEAQLTDGTTSNNVRLLQGEVLRGSYAVQIRVVTMQHWGSASPPSAWFHPLPPPPPEALQVRFNAGDEDGLRVDVAWMARWDNFLGEGAPAILGPVGYTVQRDFLSGTGPRATRFQARLRPVLFEGDVLGTWSELAHQPISAFQVGADDEELGDAARYEWSVQGQEWFSQAGVALEVQMRHGNALSWSSWSPGALVTVGLQPPQPAAGDELRLLDPRPDSVTLSWFPFVSTERDLHALEYRVMVLELPDKKCDRPESGGKVVAWKMADIVSSETTDPRAPMTYVVQSLVPSRRYLFAVECWYARMPPAVALAASARIETLEPLPSRALRLSILTGSLSAEVALAPQGQVTIETTSQTQQPHGFTVRLRWQIGIAPVAYPLPPILCYQLCCSMLVGSDKILLPPGLLGANAVGEGVGCFAVDREGETAAVDVELSRSALEGLFQRVKGSIHFAVRVGDPNSGEWSAWSQDASNPVDIALHPPTPRGPVLVSEELWGPRGGSLPRGLPHAVRELRATWQPFGPAACTAARWHQVLAVEYTLAVLAVDAGCANALDQYHLYRAGEDQLPKAREVFQERFRQSFAEVEAGELPSLSLPGDALQPGRLHYICVRGRYTFGDGSRVPEIQSTGECSSSAFTEELYQPTPLRWPAPAICATDLADSSERCLELDLPHEVNSTGTMGQPLIVDYRVGCVYRAAPSVNPTVVPTGDWLSLHPDLVRSVPDGRLQVPSTALGAEVCQFRVRRGTSESEPSAWVDVEVWLPEVAQLRHLGVGSKVDESRGLGVALVLGCGGAGLAAQLKWPRHPPQATAVSLARYQLRFQGADAPALPLAVQQWHALPHTDLPHGDPDTAVHVLGQEQLKYGGRYSFSLRLCDTQGRWSPWSPRTAPLRLELPPPAAGGGVESGDLRVLGSATLARVTWRPFAVPARSEAAEAPLLLSGEDASAGCVIGDYEVAAREEGASEKASVVVHCRGPLLFAELPRLDMDHGWLEAEVQLEPQKTYHLSVRARAPCGGWGPALLSAPLGPRLAPISTGVVRAELSAQSYSQQEGHLDMAVCLEWPVRGFLGAGTYERWGESCSEFVQVEQQAAQLAKYQVRSCVAADRQSNWVECVPVDIGTAYDLHSQLVKVSMPVHAVALPLLSGSAYVFAVRCADVHGRWTAWSTPSEAVSTQVPTLLPPQEDKSEAGLHLRLQQLTDRAVALEWSHFRVDWGHGAPSQHLDKVVEHIVYRLRVERRLPQNENDPRGNDSTERTTSHMLCEKTCDRRVQGVLSHHVDDLDEASEYVFHLSARWADIPHALGKAQWTAEISSRPLEPRQRTLRVPAPPSLEVIASDATGIILCARWRACAALRDGAGHPVPGAWYQYRLLRGRGPLDPHMDWQPLAKVLEDPASLSADIVSELPEARLGDVVRLSVRVGDADRCTEWSPASEPVTVGVGPPVPTPGDVLQISCDPRGESATLEWRPFRRHSSELCGLEYRISAMSWASEESEDLGVLARLRRVAEQERGAAGGAGLQARLFTPMGYLSQQDPSSTRLQWTVEGLRPGRFYRFFVCARYEALPAGAVVLPQEGLGGASPICRSWPDALPELEGAAWEAYLSRIGLWSTIVNTVHMVQAPSAGIRPPMQASLPWPEPWPAAAPGRPGAAGAARLSPPGRAGGWGPAAEPGAEAWHVPQEHM
ncbi:MAG: hypothetical protein CMC97_06570, partial [Flavobacteriales bacterium]|nr:hypothetical protein [Flavobacteriales bacterium]